MSCMGRRLSFKHLKRVFRLRSEQFTMPWFKANTEKRFPISCEFARAMLAAARKGQEAGRLNIYTCPEMNALL